MHNVMCFNGDILECKDTGVFNCKRESVRGLPACLYLRKKSSKDQTVSGHEIE